MAEPTEAERVRPASQPVHRVAALRDVRIPVSDGLELSANLWLPEPATDGSGPTVFPAILEMIPYRKDDWRAASDGSRGEWLGAGGARLRVLPARRPRHRIVARHRGRRVHRPRDTGRRRGGRVAGDPGVVQR